MQRIENRVICVANILRQDYNGNGEEDVIDILTDLMHYCKRESIDFRVALEMAREHFREELLDEYEGRG